jgi:hypothetical protein
MQWEDEAYPLPDFTQIKASNGWGDTDGGGLEGSEAIQAEWLEAGFGKCEPFRPEDDYAELGLSELQLMRQRMHTTMARPKHQKFKGEWSRWKFEPEWTERGDRAHWGGGMPLFNTRDHRNDDPE